MRTLTTQASKTLDRIINNWESVPQEYKKGYQIGDTVYTPLEQLKVIKECSKKKHPVNADFKALALIPAYFRHAIYKDMFRTIRTSVPAYVNSYIKYKGKIDTVAYKSSACLVCNDEVLIDIDIDVDDMNRYIFETHGEKTDYKIEELTLGLPTDDLPDIDFEYGSNYDSYLETFEKEWVQIKAPLCYVHTTPFGFVVYKWKEVAELNAHMIWYEDEKPRDFCSHWRADPNKRSYAKMDMYPPPLSCPEGVFNLWSGFDIKGDASLGKCEPFLEHLGHIKEGKDYIINWISWIVQNPGKKTLICPVLRGKPGCGKSLIVDILIKMFGSKLAHSTGKMSEIFEKHSHIRNGRIFINIDEMDAKSGYTHNEVLKNATTAETLTYEPKGINPSVQTNFNNFFVTTNNDKSVVYQEGERRYAPFDMDDELVGNHEYFDALIEWSNDENNIASLFNYFNNVDLSNVNLKLIPQTEALLETKMLSLPTIIKFMEYKIVQHYHESWDKGILGTDLHTDFLFFSGFKKEEHNLQKFGHSMKKYLEECPGLTKKKTNHGVVWTIDRKVCFDWLVQKQYTTETELSPVIQSRNSSDW